MSKNNIGFRESILDKNTFTVTWELIPGRGAVEESQKSLIKMAEAAAAGGKVSAVTITDNPGGKPALLSSALAGEINAMGLDSLIHFSCKDRNRNIIQSELYSLERTGCNNILVMTGDYPTEGYVGRPKPVFDIDATQALRMIEAMNKGEQIKLGAKNLTLKPTNLFAGAVVSPFKNTEAELITQYYKLERKIRNGAKFIYTQLGYNPAKFAELREYMTLKNLNVPLVGNIFVLSAFVAGLMNKNKVPGCIVSDGMVKALNEEKDKYGNSKEMSLLRAAKLYAVLKGLKYDGVNISGHGIKYPELEYILEKGEELYANWQEHAMDLQSYNNYGFHYFQQTTFDQEPLTPVDTTETGERKFSVPYNIFKAIHFLYFAKKGPMFGLMKAMVLAAHGTFFEKMLTGLEYWIKMRTNDCSKCGDCALSDLAYLCPMSQCPKQQRNGPCGGSYNGWCEVYPNVKKCIYVRAYSRLKSDGRQSSLENKYIKPCNWDLYETSSWFSYFSGKDYNANPDE